MTKSIILFDIDNTLFDNRLFWQKIDQEIIKVLGKTSQEKYFLAKRKYQQSLKADREFDPKKFVDFIVQETNFENRKKLLGVFYLSKKIYQNNLFPDSLPALKKLSKKYRLGILTEGTIKFQKYKLNALDIKKYLDSKLIYIFRNKTLPFVLAKIPKNIIFIDNNRSIVEVYHKAGFKVIWLNRPSGDNLQKIMLKY